MTKKRSGFLVGMVMGFMLSVVIAKASNHDTGASPTPTSTLGFIFSGTRYLPKGNNFRLGYVVGSLDAFLLSSHLADTGEQVFDFKPCVDNWTVHQMMVVVDRYLNENPNERNQSAALITHKALKAACRIQTPPAVEPGPQ